MDKNNTYRLNKLYLFLRLKMMHAQRMIIVWGKLSDYDNKHKYLGLVFPDSLTCQADKNRLNDELQEILNLKNNPLINDVNLSKLIFGKFGYKFNYRNTDLVGAEMIIMEVKINTPNDIDKFTSIVHNRLLLIEKING